MYRVLLPVDENESRARAQAEAVLELPCAASEVAVDVLHVDREPFGPDAEWAAGGFSEAYAEEMERLQGADDAPDSVETAVEVLESGGVDCTVHAATGDPPEVILAAAPEYDSDRVVIGVRRRSPVGKVLFGSVAQAVILDSEVPVTVVPVE